MRGSYRLALDKLYDSVGAPTNVQVTLDWVGHMYGFALIFIVPLILS